ncbi:MAG: hypothetical protein HC845_05570 [Akkermansiaceae bacterium]|nr:hypothetical protein [Akkermansiaceae bacterium]
MKPNYLLPALAAVLGFSIAWIAKPAGTSLPAPVTDHKETTSKPVPSPRMVSENRNSGSVRPKPKDVNASDFPLADQFDQGPKTRDEARMLRLTEALGLSIDQQGKIISLIEDVQSKLDSKLPVLEDLTNRGKMVEAGLEQILTPEQLAKFQEIRIRERENRTELRAQKMLADALEDIDVGPDQREELMARLREKVRSDLQPIPAAATLLFDKSILPTSNKELSVDGLLLLSKMSNKPTSNDGNKVHQEVMESQRRELEEILKCFDGVLTGGQMGQYQAIVHERRATLKRMRENSLRAEAEAEFRRQNPPPAVLGSNVPAPVIREEEQDAFEVDPKDLE